MKLIEEIVKSLQPKDPVLEAIKSLEQDPTHLEDDQVEMLADYMQEMIAASKKRGNVMSPQEAAGMALEDVSGFETAPPKILSNMTSRLVQAYLKKFGV